MDCLSWVHEQVMITGLVLTGRCTTWPYRKMSRLERRWGASTRRMMTSRRALVTWRTRFRYSATRSRSVQPWNKALIFFRNLSLFICCCTVLIATICFTHNNYDRPNDMLRLIYFMMSAVSDAGELRQDHKWRFFQGCCCSYILISYHIISYGKP